jgi:hypothetical protein
MKTNFDSLRLGANAFESSTTLEPMVFHNDFNDKTVALNGTQAWSLFFTGGKTDKILGFEPGLGRLFTLTTVAVAAVSIVSSAGWFGLS